MKTNGIPKIRFKGFTDDWEQRKLSELYNKNTEKNEELISYDKTISIATMTYKNGGNGASDKSLKAYKVLRVGDLAFEGHTNKKFKYGRFVLNDIGTGIMSPRFSTLRPIQCMPISFWKYYIHYEPIMQKILVNSTKAGTMMNELVIPEFLKQSILVPSMNEQKKIGEYFSNLDHLITLHQRKCEQTKELKKFMLQKMFPKKGEKNPEIRFPGFTDDWEQRKLGEIAEFNPKSDLPDEFEYVDLESVVGTEMVFHRTENKASAPSRAQRVAKTGDVFFQTVRPYQRNNYLFSMPYENYVFSTGYAQMRPKINAAFLMCFLQTESFVQNVLDNCTGTSYPAINSSDLSNLKISLPILKSEQSKIGELISNLDHLITLHQRKCEQLKELKKFMLQNMFPKKG